MKVTFNPAILKYIPLQQIEVMFSCKIVQHVEIYIPCNCQVYPITNVGVIALSYQIKKNINTFRRLFRNYNRQKLCLAAQLCSMSRSKYPAILKYIRLTHFGIIALFNKIFKILILFVLYFRNYSRQKLCLIANCSACRDLHTHAIFRYIPFPILELFPFFHKLLILFVLYFQNYKRQMVS